MTDLTWLTDDTPVSGVRNDDGDFIFWSPVPNGGVVRLTWVADRLHVNGVDEHREDFMALVGACDMVAEADLGPSEVAYLGTYND